MIKSSIIICILSSSFVVADMSFEDWEKRDMEAFANYQSRIDREFGQMLKTGKWEEYKPKDELILYNRPKPSKLPILAPKPNITQEPISIDTEPLTIPSIPSTPPKPIISGQQRVKFNFFNINIELSYSNELKHKINRVSNLNIAEFWNHCSSSNYSTLIDGIKGYQKSYRLDDWATYLLVQEVSKKINQDINSQNLLSWFILIKLGIDTKIGYFYDNIVQMTYSKDKIYGVKYFNINGKKYYAFNKKSDLNLKIYQGGMRDLDAMRIANKMVKLPFDIKHKSIRFNYNSREYLFDIEYNQNLVNLYQKYPQIDYTKYVGMSTLTKKIINIKLSKLISSMNKIEAINFLLRFTQKGFKYKTDNENFGKEKVMFFEETLYYSYSDCEDRAIFFSSLIKELLDLDIVFIKYPNHLATAIKLNSTIGGDSITYNNERYYIADPTYINANIGQAMSQLKGQKIKIIKQ